jgi:N6-adenosine-specific RNA methylase IME4
MMLDSLNIKAGVLLVDPPWHYRTFSDRGQGRSPSQHYATLDPRELAELPVSAIAAPDCWLFLWIPSAHLPDGLRVAEAWGFRFSGRAFAWLKPTAAGGFHIGLGKTTRKQVEDVWLFQRGSPRILAHDVSELIIAPRREHSRKPDQAYQLIERLCAGPFVELFARQQFPGWVCVGDEPNKFERAAS